MAAAVAWMAATVGLVSILDQGRLFRPGVVPAAGDVALALGVMLAIGWPLLSARSVSFALASGQGFVTLAIDAARQERATPSIALSAVVWILCLTTAWVLRAAERRRLAAESACWTLLLLVSIGCAVGRMGVGWF